jgi:hypothetical protein
MVRDKCYLEQKVTILFQSAMSTHEIHLEEETSKKRDPTIDFQLVELLGQG